MTSVNSEVYGIYAYDSVDGLFELVGVGLGGTTVRDNIVAGSGRADVALSAPAGAGNCFSGNRAGRIVPVALQTFQPCSGPRLPWRWDQSTAANNLGYVAGAARGCHRTTRHVIRPLPRRSRSWTAAPTRPCAPPWTFTPSSTSTWRTRACAMRPPIRSTTKPRLPGRFRAAVVGGGAAAYVLVLAIGAPVGGVV